MGYTSIQWGWVVNFIAVMLSVLNTLWAKKLVIKKDLGKSFWPIKNAFKIFLLLLTITMQNLVVHFYKKISKHSLI